MLSKQLQEQIEQEAVKLYPLVGDVKKRIGYEAAAAKYAALYETAIARAERAEKALNLIAQMSDPGDYWKAICDMKAIASNALTPKTGSDE